MGRSPRIRLLAPALAAAAVVAAGGAGCSNDEDETTPAACLVTSDDYIRTLEAAPGQVRLDGDTPISDCLIPTQEGGELARVGEQMVIAATQLNQQAREDPSGPAAVELGYLIGAVSKGADSIHTDLERRMQSAANFTEQTGPSAQFTRDFGRGYAAGRESG